MVKNKKRRSTLVLRGCGGAREVLLDHGDDVGLHPADFSVLG